MSLRALDKGWPVCEKDVRSTTAFPLWLPFSALSLNGMLVPTSHSAAVKPSHRCWRHEMAWQLTDKCDHPMPEHGWKDSRQTYVYYRNIQGGDLYKSREENNNLSIFQSHIMIPANTFYTSLLMLSMKCLIRDGILPA